MPKTADFLRQNIAAVASRLQCGKPVCSTMTEMRNSEWLNYIYTLNRCTACRFGVYPFISSEQRVYWLAEGQSLEACKKLSLVVTFMPSESARPNQIADLIKEQYILNRCI